MQITLFLDINVLLDVAPCCWHVGTNVSKALAASIFRLRNDPWREQRHVIIEISVLGQTLELHI
jgi:hypothetical protein